MSARNRRLIAIVALLIVGGITMGFPFAAGVFIATLWSMTIDLWLR